MRTACAFGLKGVSSRVIHTKNYPRLRKNLRESVLWSPPTLPAVVAARRSQCCVDTLNSKGRRISNARTALPSWRYIPALKGEALRENH